jgi:hypothetical protein
LQLGHPIRCGAVAGDDPGDVCAVTERIEDRRVAGHEADVRHDLLGQRGVRRHARIDDRYANSCFVDQRPDDRQMVSGVKPQRQAIGHVGHFQGEERKQNRLPDLWEIAHHTMSVEACHQ